MEEWLKLLANNKYIQLAENLASKQTLEHLKNSELVVGYEHIMALAEKPLQTQDVTLDRLVSPEARQLNIVATYQNTVQADVLVTFKEFCLCAEGAFLTFTLDVKGISSAPKAGFLDKIKISGASAMSKLFPQMAINKIFDNRTLAEGVYASIENGVIKVDFRQAIAKTPLGRNFCGYSILNFVYMKDLSPEEKGLVLGFGFILPDWLKSMGSIFFTAQVKKLFNHPPKISGRKVNRPLTRTLPKKGLANKFFV